MKESTIAECVIRHISRPKARRKKGFQENEFFYLVEIYNPHKRNWKYRTSFMEITKAKLLKTLKEEYML